MLLILDLDETLMHASEAPLGRPHDFLVAEYYVYKRPHVHDFLAFCRAHFAVAVWTSSTADYAVDVVRELFGNDYPLEFVWARDRCTPRYRPETGTSDWEKNLQKVRRRGYALERVIAVDDSPQKLVRSYGNLVRVRPFEGDPADGELPELARYLLRLRDVPNVRAVEKRNWRSQSE
jgi:RNA polymerase II subunit A small phosphatase-like protein